MSTSDVPINVGREAIRKARRESVSSLGFDQVVERLSELNCDPHDTQNGVSCRCPTAEHEDHNPSGYVIDKGADGWVVGCSACGSGREYFVRFASFMEDRAPKSDPDPVKVRKGWGWDGPSREEVYEYWDCYLDTDGHVTDRKGYTKTRVQAMDDDGKDIPGEKTFYWHPHRPRPGLLYRLADVLQHPSVLVLEGEKDCAWVGAHIDGNVSARTTLPDGGTDPETLKPLVGKDVTIIADNDAAGHRRARRTRDALKMAGHTAEVPIYICTRGKDPAEHLANGGRFAFGTEKGLVLLEDEDSTTTSESSSTTTPGEHEESDPQYEKDVLAEARRLMVKREAERMVRDAEAEARDYSSLEPADLVSALDEPDIEPTMLERTDGRFGLYPGKVHTIAGEYESGKSWLALLAIKQALDSGGTVCVIDYEDDGTTFAKRLHSLGVPKAVLGSGRVRYLRPEFSLDERSWAAVARSVDGADLVVVDGTSDGMAMEGLNPFAGNDDSAVRWIRILRRICDMSGAAVLSIDHVGKSADRGRHAIGGQHKGSGLSGPLFIVDKVVQPFGVGLCGRAEVWVSKDRPGQVRGWAGPMDDRRMQKWGEFVLDSTSSPSKAYIEPWDLAAPRPLVVTPLMRQVYDFVADRHAKGITTSKANIEDGVRGKATAVREARNELVRMGCLRDDGAGKVPNATYYVPVEDPDRIGSAPEKEE